MRLISFSVRENYRSITKAKRIDLGGSTVLVGPNNKGKSNLVRGLVLAIQVLADSTGFTAEGVMALPGRRQLRALLHIGSQLGRGLNGPFGCRSRGAGRNFCRVQAGLGYGAVPLALPHRASPGHPGL